MSVINFDVIDKIVRRRDGFNPVRGERNYTKLHFDFERGYGWDNCEFLTCSFFVSADQMTKSVPARFDSETGYAEFTIPGEYQTFSGRLFIAVQGTYEENGETVTVSSNIACVDVSKGLLVEEGAEQGLYESLMVLLNTFKDNVDDELDELENNKEDKINKVQSIGSQSQTGDNDKYPSVTAVRDYVNTKTDDLQDYIENDLDDLEIDTLKDTVFSSVNGDVEQGSYHTAGGWKYDTDIACRTASCTPQTALRAVFNDGIKVSVRAFTINGTYVGGYTGSGFSTDHKQFVKLDSPIALRDLTAEYDYNLQLVFTKSAGGNIVPNDVGLQYEFSAIPDEAEIYTVGTNGDFSGFTEMLIALASNSKEKIVYVDGGVYDIFDEMGGAEYISSIENASPSLSWRSVNHIVPPNTTIIGVGKVVLEWNPSDSEIIDQNHAFLFSPLNLSGSCTIKNIEIRCSNCRYGIHDETGGIAVYDGTERVLDNVRVYFTASTYGVHYAYGAGHNKNSKYIYNNCVFSAAYGIAWSSHDWPATEYENSTFEFNNCIFKNNLPTSPSGKAGIRFSSSATDSRQDIVKINGCDFNNITFGTEGSGSVKQGYTVTTMLCPSFTVTYSNHIASEDRIAPTVYLTLS